MIRHVSTKTEKLSSLLRNTGSQKKCSLCPKKKRLIQRRSANQMRQDAVPPIVHEVLRSPGQPLDGSEKDFFESRFGHDFGKMQIHSIAPHASQADLIIGAPSDSLEREADRAADRIIKTPQASKLNNNEEARFDFSSVRLHKDALAAKSAQAVGARAFTVGQDIVFGMGQHDPGTTTGVTLLAHELTHVIQQTRVHASRFSEKGIGLRTVQRQPAQSSNDSTLWFADPKVASDPLKPDRMRVFVETNLSTVGNMNIRFAYPLSEMVSTGNYVSAQSKTVADAKNKILSLIAEVIAEVGTYSAVAVPIEEEYALKQDRARLNEAFNNFPASKPLNIFIATLDSPAELISGKYVPTTDSVYVDVKDIGNRSKLEAAIRLPLQNLAGGIVPKSGQHVQAQSNSELKKTILHEALHVMLIKQGTDANSLWNSMKSGFTIQGSPSAQAKGVELIRKFLIAQEEVFVYESVAKLYPPIDRIKPIYDLFINGVKRLLKDKQNVSQKTSKSISVSENVDKKNVAWSINYEQPSSLTLGASDVTKIDLTLGIWPAR